jgi:hypothetical protein
MEIDVCVDEDVDVCEASFYGGMPSIETTQQNTYFLIYSI